MKEYKGGDNPPDVMETAVRKIVDEKKSLRDVVKDFEVGFRLVRPEVTVSLTLTF